MDSSRKPLDFGGLEDFDVTPAAVRPAALSVAKPVKKAIDKVATFPSREASEDSQMNIKASADILERFRQMAKKERYRHGEFLQVLMDAYGKKR